MAPTNRMAKCREKMKKDSEKWNNYLEKDRERKKKQRKQEKKKLEANKLMLEQKRRKDRERQQIYRKKKAQVKKNNDENIKALDVTYLGTYKSPRTLGKAIKKAKDKLPSSPSKKKAVLKRLIEENFGLTVCRGLFKKQRKGPRQLTEECISKVRRFFNNDEISRQAPGKRDVKSVKDPKTGERTTYQVRHMVMGIREAYEEFKVQNPYQQISLSKFYDLRPKHILPVSQMPHSVCVCVKHANFMFLLDSIAKSVPSFPENHKDLLTLVSCDIKSEKCMMNECDDCIYDLKTLLPENTNLEKKYKWKEWEKENNRPNLVENITSLQKMIAALNSQLRAFKIHFYVKKAQSKHFDSCKDSLEFSPNKAVMQIDFSENYELIHQDEIQSAHWSHSQAAIFTCCIWHGKDVYSFAIVSDDLSHSKNSVWFYIKTLLSEVKNISPEIDHVNIFSDNCAGQFKNRYSVSNVCFSEKDFNITMNWNFFASGHGKGAVDGVGGSIKRTVWKVVKGRKAVVSSAGDFYKVAKEKCRNINVLYVSEQEVCSYSANLEARWNEIEKIVGIQSFHHFRAYDENHILVGKTSESLMTKVCIIQEPEAEDLEEPASAQRLRYTDVYSDSSENEDESINDSYPLEDNYLNSLTLSDISPGTHVLVKLFSEKGKEFRYVAVCQSCVKENNDVEVSFFKSYNNSHKVFKINEGDEKLVSISDILEHLEEPTLKTVGDRVLYEFKNEINVLEN